MRPRCRGTQAPKQGTRTAGLIRRLVRHVNRADSISVSPERAHRARLSRIIQNADRSRRRASFHQGRVRLETWRSRSNPVLKLAFVSSLRLCPRSLGQFRGFGGPLITGLPERQSQGGKRQKGLSLTGAKSLGAFLLVPFKLISLFPETWLHRGESLSLSGCLVDLPDVPSEPQKHGPRGRLPLATQVLLKRDPFGGRFQNI